MDPFVLVDQAVAQGRMTQSMSRSLRRRSGHLVGAVVRVQAASGLNYPPYYIEPSLPMATSSVEFGSAGILYSRVIPTVVSDSVLILVQFAAPLVLLGTKATIEAVAAHEFTHYVDLVRRLSTMAVVSDEEAGTLFESAHADTERISDPKLIFSERALVALVNRKFKKGGGLVDNSLDSKVTERWMNRGLPTRSVAASENFVRLSAAAVARTRFDPMVLQRIKSIEGASA